MKNRNLSRRLAGLALTAGLIVSLSGCAVASATAGAAISITGAVASTAIKVTGSAASAAIDAISDDD